MPRAGSRQQARRVAPAPSKSVSPFLLHPYDPHSSLSLLEACTLKLKQLTQLVLDDEVDKDEVVPSLLNSARLLEKVFVDRTKGLHSEEQEEDLFSVISNGTVTDPREPSEPVPDRVQEWLTNTFTRRASVTLSRRRRLRSLATVIQTGVYFEKLFRGRLNGKPDSRPSVPIPSNIYTFLKAGAHTWDFDPFELTDLSNSRPVRMMGLFLFEKFDLIEKFSISMPTLEAFLNTVEEGYRKHGNPYHNVTHSADVTQSCCYIVSQHNLATWLTDLEMFSLIFAALVHDYEHTGTTNNFHVQTRSSLALVYNDKSVLESYHASAIFRKMNEQQSDCNILSGLNQLEYRQFRSLVIDMVLATDMSTHFSQVTAIKDAIPCPENLPRVDILAYILHAADISHPAKVWSLHEQWTKRLTDEFFAQGDREKELGLPCSPLCDRDKTVVASSQVGFIEYIVEPCFHTLIQLLQGVKNLLSPVKSQHQPNASELTNRPGNPTPDTITQLANLHSWQVMEILCSNRDKWKDMAEQEKRKMASIQEEEEAGSEEAGRSQNGINGDSSE